jgi:hypothetical protein
VRCPPLFLLAILLLASGCATPHAPGSSSATGTDTGSSSSGSRCAGAGGASGNAPLLPPFQGDLDEVARRAGRAIGDPGNVTAQRTATGFALLYAADRVWPGLDEDAAGAELRRYLAAAGVPASVRFNESYYPPGSSFGYTELKPRLAQRFAGGELGVFGLDTWHSQHTGQKRAGGTVGPFYDLSAARVLVSRDRAVELASAFLGCEGWAAPAELQATETPRFGVAASSLSWVLDLRAREEGHHCGGKGFQVWLDAETGRVHHFEAKPCI